MSAPTPYRQKATRSNPPTIRDSTSIVTITIQASALAEPKTYSIHKNFVCYYSPFFASAFNSNFLEGRNQAMHLDDVEPEVFGLFIYWIYYQDIPNEPTQPGYLLNVARLWVMAQRFLIPRLQNAAIQILNRGFYLGIYTGHQSLAPFLWELGKDNPMTRLFIDSLAHYDNTFLESFDSYIPAEMGLEVLKIMKKDCKCTSKMPGNDYNVPEDV